MLPGQRPLIGTGDAQVPWPSLAQQEKGQPTHLQRRRYRATSRKQCKHIRGKRGEAFLRIVRGIDRAHILCVSLDVGKYFHLVMMHNAYGEIVTPSFEIDIFRSGFEHLCQVIDETVLEELYASIERGEISCRFGQSTTPPKPEFKGKGRAGYSPTLPHFLGFNHRR